MKNETQGGKRNRIDGPMKRKKKTRGIRYVYAERVAAGVQGSEYVPNTENNTHIKKERKKW